MSLYYNWLHVSRACVCLEKTMTFEKQKQSLILWWMLNHGPQPDVFLFPFCVTLPWEEKEMATHSSVLAWRIPGMGEPGGLPSMGSHRVRHDWSDLADLADGTNCLEIYELKIVNISCTVSGAGSGIQEGLAEWSGSPPGGCSHLRFSRTAGWGSSSFMWLLAEVWSLASRASS